jgi:hypothetical protein
MPWRHPPSRAALAGLRSSSICLRVGGAGVGPVGQSQHGGAKLPAFGARSTSGQAPSAPTAKETTTNETSKAAVA